jgi:hypothetical protein
MERKIIFLTIVVFVFLITGCGGEESSSASSREGGSVVRTDFSPSEPTSSDVITLKVNVVSEDAPLYKWIVNGIPISAGGNKLGPENFYKNDTVFCAILIGGEEKKKIGPIVIRNSAPKIDFLTISPTDPKHGTDLSINADVSDVDGDDVVLRVKWFVNEEEVSAEEVLSGSKIKAADKVYADVTPFDGTDEGLPLGSDYIIVQNSPPAFITMPFSSNNSDKDGGFEVKDPDGDNIDLLLEEGPPGMRLEGARLVWEIPEVEKDTSFTVKVKARDERGGENSISFFLDVKRTEMQ